MTARLVLLPALLAATACSSSRYGLPSSYAADEVPAAIEASRADLEAGESGRALERMLTAQETPELSPARRQEIQNVVERAAADLIAELDDPGALRDLTEVDLPRTLAVEAGIRAARLLLDDGERMKSFRQVRRLDAKFPQHHERNAAGAILAEAGFSLAEDGGRYGLFYLFRYRSLAPQVLEYLVLNYPSDPHGARALWTLADLYEADRQWDLAIAKLQNLILWFPVSEHAVAAEARIPHLRLCAILSPEHDRHGLLTARDELERWLADHPGHPLEADVRLDLTDAEQRLADNDLIVARFYRTVKNRAGAEYHARRAVEEARAGGDADQIAEAEELLEVVAGGGQ